MKSGALPSRIILLLMVALIILSPQVQLSAWYETPDQRIREEHPIREYLLKYSEYLEKCPLEFQKYTIDQMLDLIDHLESDDPTNLTSFEEIKGLGEFLAYLAQEGIEESIRFDHLALNQDLA